MQVAKVDGYPDVITALATLNIIGFTQLQAKAYIALIELGEATGSAVADVAGINRSKIYDTLNDLESMKAVQRVSRNEKKKFIAVDPETLFSSIFNKFTEQLRTAKNALLEIKSTKNVLSETTATLTNINLKDLNTNDYKYLITDNEKTRIALIEKLTKKNRPTTEVILLNMNLKDTANYCMLVGSDIVLFEVPAGAIIENALLLQDISISNFFTGFIENAWDASIYEKLTDEMGSILHIGTALFVEHKLNVGTIQHNIISRPVNFIITESHISFIYEQNEDIKVPVKFMQQITLEDTTLQCQLINVKSGAIIGSLKFKVLNKGMIVRNILQLLTQR